MHHAPVRIPICVVVGFFCPVPAGESISKVHNLPNQNVEPDAIKCKALHVLKESKVWNYFEKFGILRFIKRSMVHVLSV